MTGAFARRAAAFGTTVRFAICWHGHADHDLVPAVECWADVKPKRRRRSSRGEAAPLCRSRHRPQSIAACLSIVGGRILSS
jgi:hypothetical protein